MGKSAVLCVRGEVAEPLEIGFADLAALPGQVEDLGTRVPGRKGGAVELSAVLERAGTLPQATHVTLVADGGSFSASVPLQAVTGAVIAYRAGAEPLAVDRGGPFRFFLPEAADCATAETDRCANVKGLSTILLTIGPGADTRPTSPDEHAALHRDERPPPGRQSDH